MQAQARTVYTMNPSQLRFLFEPRFGIELNMKNPHLRVDSKYLENPEFKAFIEKALKDRVLLEGEVKVEATKLSLGESPISPEAILSEAATSSTITASLREICEKKFRYLEDGKLRTAANDINILVKYEVSHLNRPAVLTLLKKANMAIEARDKGSISPIEETVEKTVVTSNTPGSPRMSETPVGGMNPIDAFFNG